MLAVIFGFGAWLGVTLLLIIVMLAQTYQDFRKR